jgi:hypothetical protein
MSMACRLAIGLVLATISACKGDERLEDGSLAMFSADHETVFQKNDRRTQAFIAGAVKGIVYYNTMMRMEGKPALFCSSTGSLSLDEFWGLASAALDGTHDQDTIVITALNGLRRRYPCSSQGRAAAPVSGGTPDSKPAGEGTRRTTP